MTNLVPIPTTSEVVTHRATRATPADVALEVAQLHDLMLSALIEGQHYGKIPGTPRPSLYKAGAEWLLRWAGLGHRFEVVEVERDDDGRKYAVTYRCLVHLLTDPEAVVSTCDGYAGYDEPDREAHRNRWGKDVPRSPWNTMLKMAQKRAMVGAALQATGASGLFTQDLEDHAPEVPMATRDMVDEVVELAKAGSDEQRSALKDKMAGATPPITFTRALTVVELDQVKTWWAAIVKGSPEAAPEPQEPAEEAGTPDGGPEAPTAAPEAGTGEVIGRCEECDGPITADMNTITGSTSETLIGECCLDVERGPVSGPA